MQVHVYLYIGQFLLRISVHECSLGAALTEAPAPRNVLLYAPLYQSDCHEQIARDA